MFIDLGDAESTRGPRHPVGRRERPARLQRTIAAIAAIVVLSAAPANGQLALAGDDAKAAEDMRKAAKRAKQTEPLFSGLEPLELTLSTNIRRIRADKMDKAPWRAATFSYAGPGGATVNIPAEIRTRGIWRLKNCEFPPLRVNFRNEDTKGTLLEGLDKPKLVNFCRDTDQFEHYVTQELQLYRVYSLLTPASHRARLARLTYVDSATGKVHAKRLGIILEEPEMMAARLGGSLSEEKGALAAHLDAYQGALAGLFNYFIGNTDWSTFALHNMELVSEADGDYLPIPYDFDFSGAINASYATVDPKLNIGRVRQRLFRGYCYPVEYFEKAFATFNEKKDAIYGLYRDPVGSTLPPKLVAETLRYFDEFYETINDPRRAKKNIIDACMKTQ